MIELHFDFMSSNLKFLKMKGSIVLYILLDFHYLLLDPHQGAK